MDTILCDSGVRKGATNEALGIKHGVLRIGGHLILGGITDQALGIREGNKGRGGAIAMFVRDDLYTVILPHTHTACSGSQIDSDGGHLSKNGMLNGILSPFTDYSTEDADEAGRTPVATEGNTDTSVG